MLQRETCDIIGYLQCVAACCSALQCVAVCKDLTMARPRHLFVCVRETRRRVGVWGSACTSEQERRREQENDNVRDRESVFARDSDQASVEKG